MPDALVVEPLTVALTAEEIDLLRTALRLLRMTLGRDEADELDDIRQLLDRLETVSRPQPA